MGLAELGGEAAEASVLVRPNACARQQPQLRGRSAAQDLLPAEGPGEAGRRLPIELEQAVGQRTASEQLGDAVPKRLRGQRATKGPHRAAAGESHQPRVELVPQLLPQPLRDPRDRRTVPSEVVHRAASHGAPV